MFAGMTQDRIESLSAGIRLQRMGELSDVAAAIAYLGSDDAAWTTGEVLGCERRPPVLRSADPLCKSRENGADP